MCMCVGSNKLVQLKCPLCGRCVWRSAINQKYKRNEIRTNASSHARPTLYVRLCAISFNCLCVRVCFVFSYYILCAVYTWPKWKIGVKQLTHIRKCSKIWLPIKFSLKSVYTQNTNKCAWNTMSQATVIDIKTLFSMFASLCVCLSFSCSHKNK